MLAVLLAVLGTAGVLVYVHQADARALAGQKAVSVLVAQSTIPSGTSASAALQAGQLASERLPAASVPAEAVSSITPALGGLVMSADVRPGQLLLRPMLVTPAQVTGALAIPGGKEAVTIAICVPGAVAGYVRPGSQVAVFATFSTSAKPPNGQASCGESSNVQGNNSIHTRLVLTRVQVLSVGPAPASGQGGTPATSTSFSSGQGSSSTSGQGTVMVTLAVSQPDAERLITLVQAGLPYMALLSPTSKSYFDTGFVPLFQP
jgi:pilus assembly protein CpaB